MANPKSVGMAYPAPMSAADKAQQRRYEVEDALRTMQRATEIVGDKKLMAEVRKMAIEKGREMSEISAKAGMLAKMGRISPSAMAKMNGRMVKDTDRDAA
jgi:hypothetical protein